MIDFRCQQCGKLLRTPAEAAGKQAQCPSCGAIQPIPVASDPSAGANPFRSATGSTVPGSDVNPYVGAAYDSSTMTARRGEIFRSQLDVGEVLNKSWEIAKPQIGILFLFGLIFLAVNFAIGMVLQFAALAFSVATNIRGPEFDILSGLAVNVGSQLIGTFITIGAIIYMLNLARGEQASFMDLFAGVPYFVRGVCAMILLYAMAMAVVLLCMTPGIFVGAASGFDSPPAIGLLLLGGVFGFFVFVYLFLTFGQFLYAIVDRDCGIIESFSISRQITQGNRLMLLVVYIVASLLVLAGICALCVGYLFAISFMYLMWTVSYLMMSGQPTATGVAPQVAPAYPTNPA